MEAEFWRERWKQNQIAFHQNDINPYLKNFWQETNLPTDAGVFVPMCGKSLDMVWLSEQGFRVIGVELSEIAAREFCRENRFHGTPRRVASGELYQFGPKISFICGDFFKITSEDIGKIQGVYDRASLVALPPEMRKKYAEHLTGLLGPGAKILMITFEYDQDKMSGPPFAVHPAEVRQLYGNNFQIREIHEQEISGTMPRFSAEKLVERVYLLTKK